MGVYTTIHSCIIKIKLNNNNTQIYELCFDKILCSWTGEIKSNNELNEYYIILKSNELHYHSGTLFGYIDELKNLLQFLIKIKCYIYPFSFSYSELCENYEYGLVIVSPLKCVKIINLYHSNYNHNKNDTTTDLFLWNEFLAKKFI